MNCRRCLLVCLFVCFCHKNIKHNAIEFCRTARHRNGHSQTITQFSLINVFAMHSLSSEAVEFVFFEPFSALLGAAHMIRKWNVLQCLCQADVRSCNQCCQRIHGKNYMFTRRKKHEETKNNNRAYRRIIVMLLCCCCCRRRYCSASRNVKLKQFQFWDFVRILFLWNWLINKTSFISYFRCSFGIYKFFKLLKMISSI